MQQQACDRVSGQLDTEVLAEPLGCTAEQCEREAGVNLIQQSIECGPTRMHFPDQSSLDRSKCLDPVSSEGQSALQATI